MVNTTATKKIKATTPKPTNGNKPIKSNGRLLGRVYNGIGIGTWQKNMHKLTDYFLSKIGLDKNIIVNGAESKATSTKYKASKTLLITDFDISKLVLNDVGNSWTSDNTIVLNSLVYSNYRSSREANDLSYTKVNHAIHSIADTLVEILAIKYQVKPSKFYDGKVFTADFETVLANEKLPIQVNTNSSDAKYLLGINHISTSASEFTEFANGLDNWEFATTNPKDSNKDIKETTLVSLSCNRKAMKELKDGGTEQTNKRLHKFTITLDKTNVNASIKNLTCLIDVETKDSNGKSKTEICGTKLESNK